MERNLNVDQLVIFIPRRAYLGVFTFAFWVMFRMVLVNSHFVQIVVFKSRGKHKKTYQISNVR